MARPRTVIVTGAAFGIGAAIATRFLAEGDSVVLFDINADGARDVADRSGRGSHSLIVQGDAGDENSVREAIRKTEETVEPPISW